MEMASLFPRLSLDLIQKNHGLGKVAFFPTENNMSTLLKSSFSQWKLGIKDSPLIVCFELPKYHTDCLYAGDWFGLWLYCCTFRLPI